VAKNEAHGLPGDYENLAMPEETRNYLPKLQAIKNIVADPARFGLTLEDIPNESYFTAITIPRHIDVALAAQFAEISIEEFRFLNPAHNKPVINANAAETIVLPKDKVESFQRNLENHTQPLVSWQAYTVRPGERIEKIAAKYRMSVAELKRVNNMPARARVRTGQPLLVPVKAGTKPHLPNLPAPRLVKVNFAKKHAVGRSQHGKLARKVAYRQTSRKRAKKPVKSTTVKSASSRKAATKTARAATTKPHRATARTVAPSGTQRVDLAEYERSGAATK
jgi:LysM repeat protein